MARKKKQEGHVNHERWLVSYADFITLLFATFTALYAISNADKAKFEAMAKSLRNAFATSIPTDVKRISVKGKGMRDHNRKGHLNYFKNEGRRSLPSKPSKNDSTVENRERNPSGSPTPRTISNASPTPTPRVGNQKEAGFGDQGNRGPSGLKGQEDKQLGPGWGDELSLKIREEINRSYYGTSVHVRKDKRGVVISLTEGGFYDPEKATVKPSAIYKLDRIIQILIEGYYNIRIEGHTDDTPIESGRFDNLLELSAIRASRLADYIENEYDYPPEKILSASGYGSKRPLAPNTTDYNRQRNRRVDIVIVKPGSAEGEN